MRKRERERERERERSPKRWGVWEEVGYGDDLYHTNVFDAVQ